MTDEQKIADKRGIVALKTSCYMHLYGYSASSINRVCDEIMQGKDPRDALVLENQFLYFVGSDEA